MKRSTAWSITVLLALTLAIVACGESAGTTPGQRPDLPPMTAQAFSSHVAQLDRPAVVNVWASWCIPCRSEAPLLDQAFAQYGDRVEFIGIDVQDNQADAKSFLEEYGLAFDHFFDRNREIPNAYGGIGTPITFFFARGGELVHTHNGVIDDRTLALSIDELLAQG